MQIAIAVSGVGHVHRGNEAWAVDLAHGLTSRGLDVMLCKGSGLAENPYDYVVGCLRRDSPLTKKIDRLLPRSAWRIGLGSDYAIEQTSYALRLIPHLRRRRFDILHTQDPYVAKIVQASRKIGLTPTRAVLAHGTEESESTLKALDYVQHLAPYHRESLRERGLDKPTWCTIPNFIDVEVFHPGDRSAARESLGLPQNAFIVLSVAAIKRTHKRIDSLLSEFELFASRHPDRSTVLLVAGGVEPDTESLISQGKQRLGDRVRFLTNHPRSEMPALYQAADLFVLTSLSEMLGIVLLEASASGLPCIVHRHPVLEWVVGPGGLIVDQSQTGNLATTISRLFSEPGTRVNLGKAGRSHCLLNFSQDAVIDQIVAYYTSIL